MKYLKIWFRFAINAFQIQMMVRWALLIFLLGKSLRFLIFGTFIYILVSHTQALAGYSLRQTMLFFLSFNLVDILSQLLYRDVYRFRAAVVEGTFDYYLIRPINVLFRSLMSGPDFMDFITLIPLIGAIIYLMSLLSLLNFVGIVGYIILLIFAFMIATAFHILILSLAVVTTEIDHAMMIYRDITSLGRVPVDVYQEPLRGLITFVIPVGMMMSFPAKFLLGLIGWQMIIFSGVFSLSIFFLAIQIWHYSLKGYSSASS